MSSFTSHTQHGSLELYVEADRYGRTRAVMAEDLTPYIEEAAIWREILAHNRHLKHLVPVFVMPQSMLLQSRREGWDDAKKRQVINDPQYRKLRVY